MNDPIQILTDKTMISKVTQLATGFALPPFIPFKNIALVGNRKNDSINFTDVSVQASEQIEANSDFKNKLTSGLAENLNWIIPLTFESFDYMLNGITRYVDPFKLPVDPIISFSSKNIIKRRYVAKKKTRGSIKEWWSMDDWEITITGVIIEEDKDIRKKYKQQLEELCEVPMSIPVACEVLNEMGIMNLAIEDYDFPFTPGEENQAFTLKCYSDDTYDLLVESKI